MKYLYKREKGGKFILYFKFKDFIFFLSFYIKVWIWRFIRVVYFLQFFDKMNMRGKIVQTSYYIVFFLYFVKIIFFKIYKSFKFCMIYQEGFRS